MLCASKETDAGILESSVFDAIRVEEDAPNSALPKGMLSDIPNEDLVTKILFGTPEPPRFVLLMGMNQMALIDRNKWNEKRYLQFELEEQSQRNASGVSQDLKYTLRESI